MGHEAVGTWRQIFHWGPMLALGVIFTISWVTINATIMWWPPHLSLGGALNFALFCTWVSITLWNYFAACIKGPGFVPLGWKPKNTDHGKYLQFCEPCQGYKAPRSHHCRKCGRCVMKMDHHCPWINTCCGHFNHGNFCLFLMFAPIGCMHAVCILIPSIYRALNFHYYYYYGRDEPLVYLSVTGFIVTMFGFGLTVGVIVAVGMLFYIQIKSVLKNETGIEGWIIEKALDRVREEEEEGEFIYPYHFGWRDNLRQVFTWGMKPLSNGLIWNVLEGCHQYTLTVEQLIQKQDKRERTIEFSVVEPYSGRIFPVSKGLRVGCCIPCTDEPRIPLEKGDRVAVTRWKKRWLYGTKMVQHTSNGKPGTDRLRGWFPRRCAVEVMDEEIFKKDS